MKKLDLCPVFQWAQQPYASPANITVDVRKEIRDQVEPLLMAHPNFFQNSENMLRVLDLPRASRQSQVDALKWIQFLNRHKKKNLFDLEPRLLSAMLPDGIKDLADLST